MDATVEDGRLDELANLLLRTSLASAALDLPSNRLTEVSESFAALLGFDASQLEGVDLLSLTSAEDGTVLKSVLAGVASGLVDSCEGQIGFRLSDGLTVVLATSVWALNSTNRPVRALVVAAATEGVHKRQPWLTQLDAKDVAFLEVDHSWCLSDMSADSAHLLGWDRSSHRGVPLRDVVHPHDVPFLLLTLVRSSVDRRAAATRLRIRGLDELWTTVRMVVSPLCAHSPARFAAAIWVQHAGEDPESSEDRSSRLEGHLWRIAVELQASGVDDRPRSGQAWWSDPRLSLLSKREWEVLRRVVAGQRGPAIASDLFVSQSTVRNHLAAIYRKMGIHSQSELLASLLPARSDH